MLFTCTIPGHPVPQSRPGFRRSGHAFTRPESRRYRDRLVREFRLLWHDREAVTFPLVITVKVAVKGRCGDVDNYAKQILDALQQAHVIHNDSQVCELHVYRVKAVDESLIVNVEGIQETQ